MAACYRNAVAGHTLLISRVALRRAGIAAVVFTAIWRVAHYLHSNRGPLLFTLKASVALEFRVCAALADRKYPPSIATGKELPSSVSMSFVTEKNITDIADLLHDAVFLVDTNGSIEYVSAACEDIFGYRPNDMAGAPMIDLVHPADRDRTIIEAKQVMSGQHRIGFENRYRHKKGHDVHIMWSAAWLQPQRLRIGVARDVTASKETSILDRGLALASAPLAMHERKVLELLLSEASEKQIADQLGLAVSTTHSYVTSIFRKFGVRGRAGLMSLWIRQLSTK